MTPLMISTEEMIELHGFFAEAAAVGEAGLGAISGCETEIIVEEIRCTALADFGERGLWLSEDLVAGVMGRLEGVMPGSLNVVLDPQDAFRWVRLGGDGDPLETFVSIGSTLLEGMTHALAEILSGEETFQGAALVEESELAMLVKTHAPSDTLVFSTKMQIDVRDEAFTAVSHMLIEPKCLAQLLKALSAAIH
jgi:hypothetical protein